MKHSVIIAIGSNDRQAVHMQWASERLTLLVDNRRASRKIWSSDIKGSGKWYMNQLLAGTTACTLDKLQQELKAVEAEAGRTKERVTIDLDILQYDTQRYHEKDWQRPYVTDILNDIL